MKKSLNINPVAKPRMTRRDKWNPSKAAAKYWGFKDHLNALMKPDDIEACSEELSITFIVPMPKSWTRKKKLTMCNRPHQQTPDLDNFIKAFQDAILKQDCGVWRYKDCAKIWGESGEIIICTK